MALSSLAAACVFSIWAGDGNAGRAHRGRARRSLGGAVYFLVNMGLLSFASGVEGHESPWAVFHERFAWLLPHYVVYGFIGAVMGIGYDAVGLYGARRLRGAAAPDAQDAGGVPQAHAEVGAEAARGGRDDPVAERVARAGEQGCCASARPRRWSPCRPRSMRATRTRPATRAACSSSRSRSAASSALSQAELDLLGHAALFHDIGKLAIPDAILLKPASLTAEEWALMQRHAEEGARIIDRLGFLQDAVPAIRHHHERFDGTGYPDRIAGEEIPLGARIIHVADALDSMLTTRIYRAARPVNEALAEVKDKAGTQFCPRCVAALERILPLDSVVGDLPSTRSRQVSARARPRARRLARLADFLTCSTILGMARKRRFQAVAAIDPEKLAEFQAGIRKRYSDEQILAELRACAERLGRSPTMREFAADPRRRCIRRR